MDIELALDRYSFLVRVFDRRDDNVLATMSLLSIPWHKGDIIYIERQPLGGTTKYEVVEVRSGLFCNVEPNIISTKTIDIVVKEK